MKTRRRQITIGLLMLLVALSAIAFKTVEYARRVRVVFVNRSNAAVRNVTVQNAGRIENLGTVAPNTEITHRIPFESSARVRVGWDVQDLSGGPDKHVTAPAVAAFKPGDVIRVQTGR